jgi:cell division protein ZapA
MAQVSVTINGRNYTIGCDSGQEEHLQKLGRYVDQRASELVSAVGQISEPLLLAMISLLLADDLSEAYGELEQYKNQDNNDLTKDETEKELVNIINRLTERISTVAQNLKDN